MEELLRLLSGQDEAVDLDRAALQLATAHYPDLEIEPFVQILDSYARELSARLGRRAGGSEYVAAANQYLFGELGFAGNKQDYYNPENSCLNRVITTRLGIPITLAVMYMEIGRRLERPVYGIGLPGHFLVQYNDGRFSVFIDPFHSGSILSSSECFRLAGEASGAAVRPDPQLLEPVSKRQIVIRMLNNLRGIYLSSRAYGKALQVLNLLLKANPVAADIQQEAQRLRRLLAAMN